jgi:PAS domain S-box-containing protein
MEVSLFKVKENGKPVEDVTQPGIDDTADEMLAARSDCRDIIVAEHFAQFYENDSFLLNSLVGFIGAGLGAGDGCVIVATNEHREELNKRLEDRGLDVAAASSCGQYISLEAGEILATFMLDGSPDPGLFAEVIGGVIARAAEGRGRVRIFGEMVALLWAEGNHTAAISLEALWNGLQQTRSFSLFCAYPMSGFSGESHTSRFGEVCAGHSRVIPAESYTALSSPEDRLRAITLLQQKARSLEAEIAERKEAEERLRVSELRYRRLFETARDGILIVDPDTRRITDANPAMTELLGVTLDELLGKELWEIGLFESLEASLESFRELREKHVVNCEHLPLSTKDGQRRVVEYVSNLYRTNGHQVIQCNVRDITERKRAEEISSHLAAIVETSDDAILSKSLDGIILSWNKGAERIFGYKASEVIGKPIQILIPPHKVDEEPAILERLKRGEHIDHYETVRVTKDGRTVDISLTISPIKDLNGKTIAASKIARDISERKRSEAEREQLLAYEQIARAEAETANRLKDEFLATVSHELRTPLNAIIGWSHMLRTGRLDQGNIARAIETIERNAKSQAQLVEDILDVSRAITGKLRLDIAPVDVASVINAAIDCVQLAADSKGIRLEVTLDPSARHASGDSNRLQQIVWNLLSNAIKFTPSGGRVEVRLERAGSALQLKVSDTGQGISPNFLPFIFDRFRQADGTSTRHHGGLGLGLAIVRHLVELHGGTVHADSPGEGCGATFTIKLPIPKEDGGKRKAETVSRKDEPFAAENDLHSSTLIPRPLRGVRVLVVDDDRDTLQMLMIVLSEYGAIVEGASSAAQALEVLQSYKPDVLVSDLAMPGEDGYSLIGKMRSLEVENGKQIPAVALTAYVRVEDRARALSAGFNMFVPKPFESNELITAIANLADAGEPGSGL